MARSHLVIGGGVVGRCIAYYLSKSGCDVLVVDGDPTGKKRCSEGNAGMVVPSHFTPLAAPGVIGQGLKWMLRKDSPFAIRPQLDPALWAWCRQFHRHCTTDHVQKSQELLRDLSLESRACFDELARELDFEFTPNGLLMLCQTERGLEEEIEVAAQANELGVHAEVCDPARLSELNPNVNLNAKGGIWFSQDGHLDPQQFQAALRRGIERNGGIFLDANITDFRVRKHRVVAATSATGETFEFEDYTVAGGAWTPTLAKKLNLHLPMQAGKGYSFTLPQPVETPRVCALLKEGRVAITPMGNQLRVAGTMELGSNDLRVNPDRLRGMIDSFCSVYTGFTPADFEHHTPWAGLRPCSSDGLPFIGSVPDYEI